MGTLRHLATGASLAAVAVAGCGSDDETTTVTDAAPAPQPSTAAAPAAPATTASVPAGASGAGALSQIAPPAGSELIATSTRDGVAFSRYKTGSSSAAVISSYERELDGDGWTVVQSGGNGGGWGPWGGSGTGLTARKAADYFDVQAGGSKQGPTYFEVCAGPGARSVCDDQSNDANTSSGGSASDDDNDNDTSSRAS